MSSSADHSFVITGSCSGVIEKPPATVGPVPLLLDGTCALQRCGSACGVSLRHRASETVHPAVIESFTLGLRDVNAPERHLNALC